MKIFKLGVIALVTMCGLNSCSDDCDHDFIEVDYSKDIVGTWTCLKADFAEALVFKADGTFASVGVANGKYWDYPDATWSLKGNKLALSSGDYKSNVRLEIIPGNSLALVDEKGNRNVFDYCENDLADEVVGMWVCNEGVAGMTIQNYQNNGKSIFTGFSLGANDYMTNMESTYNVVGDLMFQKTGDMYFVTRLAYVPNGTSFGDILHTTATIWVNNAYVTSSYSFLRVKQTLNLTGQIYDYNTAYVTNAKGADEDFTIMGNTFNIAKIKAGDFDKMFRADLFNVELDANSFKYKLRLDNGQDTGFDAPMTVDGNKVTLDMSAINPVLRKVEMYMFQDADDTQVHVYMNTDAFINYFANMEVYTLILEGKINPSDSAAIAKVFADMEARIESINVTFVMKVRK